MRTRAERRHHHKRMLDKVKNFSWLRYIRKEYTQEDYEQHLKHIAETRKPCSCHMCGNPRKYWKEKTIQEKKFDEYDIE